MSVFSLFSPLFNLSTSAKLELWQRYESSHTDLREQLTIIIHKSSLIQLRGLIPVSELSLHYHSSLSCPWPHLATIQNARSNKERHLKTFPKQSITCFHTPHDPTCPTAASVSPFPRFPQLNQASPSSATAGMTALAQSPPVAACHSPTAAPGSSPAAATAATAG